MLSQRGLRLIFGLIVVISSFLTVPSAFMQDAEGAVDIEKYVSVDGGTTWMDANSAPGPLVEPGESVSFRLFVTNTGEVELTDIVLTDSAIDASSCPIPAALAPEASFSCDLGPVDAEEGQVTNTATVTATAGEETVTDTDSANYYGGDKLPVVIVVEGPIQEIIVNVIVVYGIHIELNVDDPILTVIRVGDVVHIEGGVVGEGNTVVIVAITVTIINVEIDINGGGNVWRDDGNCKNPPPSWAPAHGWRRRCGGGEGGEDDQGEDDD
jgi:hypothetical protein